MSVVASLENFVVYYKLYISAMVVRVAAARKIALRQLLCNIAQN
ncbi:hypothetical protein Cal6303_2930 [Calothrix sp. PCC 6303]|nr:hypothetical protein Cal6303_2930 [Calothrix sp. PCC 6303]